MFTSLTRLAMVTMTGLMVTACAPGQLAGPGGDLMSGVQDILGFGGGDDSHIPPGAPSWQTPMGPVAVVHNAPSRQYPNGVFSLNARRNQKMAFKGVREMAFVKAFPSQFQNDDATAFFEVQQEQCRTGSLSPMFVNVDPKGRVIWRVLGRCGDGLMNVQQVGAGEYELVAMTGKAWRVQGDRARELQTSAARMMPRQQSPRSQARATPAQTRQAPARSASQPARVETPYAAPAMPVPSPSTPKRLDEGLIPERRPGGSEGRDTYQAPQVEL